MTTWWGWVLRRAGSSRLLLATLLALVTVTTAILAFVVGQAGALATDAARAALSSAEPGAGAIQAQTRLGDDPAAQDQTARRQLAEGFAAAPVTIYTTYVSEPRRTTITDEEHRITLWAGDHLVPGLLEVTDGTWPSSPAEAALQAGAAAALGLTPGDTFTIDDHPLTLTALWQAAEQSTPIWFGEQLLTDGADDTSVGPLITDRSVLTGGAPFIRWSVVPDASRITPEHLEVLADGAERAKMLVAEADLTGRGIVVNGDLASTAERASRDWSVGRAFGIVPVSVLLLVAGVGLVQVSALLAATRQREHELLAARGASRRQLLVTGLSEGTVVAMVGAALGTGIALGALLLLSGGTAQFGVAALGGLGSLLLALICLWTVIFRATSTLTGKPRQDRVRAVAGVAALVVVFAAAAVTTWQLRSSPAFELVPALAPAFLLAAAAVLGLAALGPVTRLIEAVTKRGAPAIWLAGAQLARSLVVHAVPVTLTILATGTATFASLYAGTAAATHRDLTILDAGAPLRVTLSSLDADGLSLPDLASIDGVSSVVPVWLDEAARVGDTGIVALAAPLSTLDDVVSLPSSFALPTLPVNSPAASPVLIPDGATALSVQLSGRSFLDAWQQEYFERAEEFILASLGDQVDELSLGWVVETWVEDFYRSLRENRAFGSKLVVRNLDTGLSRSYSGPSLAMAPESEALPQTFVPLTGRAAVTIELPREGRFVVDGFQLSVPSSRGGGQQHIEVDIAVLADGQPLSGAEEWTSDLAVSSALAGPYRDAVAAVDPAWEAETVVVEHEDGSSQTMQLFDSNQPPHPAAVLNTTQTPWRLVYSGQPEAISVGPQVAFTGHDPDGVMAQVVPPQPQPVPVAITEGLAAASTLTLDSALDLAAFGRRIPAVVRAITPAVPGSTSSNAVLMDSAAVAEYLAGRLSPLRWPSHLWADFDGDPAAARAAAAQLPGVEAIHTLEETPARTASAAQSLWIAGGSALLLSLTGLAAAAATQLGARRAEVAVLRALGMTPQQQGRSRAWETGGVLAVATAAGVAAGWAVSWLVVEPIVQAASDNGSTYRSPLTAELGPWAALLGAGALSVLVILWLLAGAVRRQAMDTGYREEVR